MANSDITNPGMVDGSPISYPNSLPVTDYTPYRVPSDMVHMSERDTGYLNMLSEDTRSYSGLAVLSIVCAVLAVPFWWLLVPAPLAVLFGFLAKINTDDGTKRGHLAAKIGRTAGLIEVGLAVVVFILLGVLAVVSWFSSPYTMK